MSNKKRIILTSEQIKKVLNEEPNTTVQINATGNNVPAVTNAVTQSQNKINNASKYGDVSLHISNQSSSGSNDNVPTQHVEVSSGENVNQAIQQQVNPTVLADGGDIEVSGDGISETKRFSKKMVEEARLEKIRREGQTMTKKQLQESFIDETNPVDIITLLNLLEERINSGKHIKREWINWCDAYCPKWPNDLIERWQNLRAQIMENGLDYDNIQESFDSNKQWQDEIKQFMKGLRQGAFDVVDGTAYVQVFKRQTAENDPRYVYIRKGDNRLRDDHYYIQNSPVLSDKQLKEIYYALGWEDELPELIGYDDFELYESENAIEIDPKNKGKFTATKEKTGKSTEKLLHSKNPLTRKRANFARMAKRGWKPLKNND